MVGRMASFGGRSVSDNITSYYRQVDISEFTYSRPFRKGPKTGNEFADLWIEQTDMEAVYFPGTLRRGEVKKCTQCERSPIENAIQTVRAKNAELRAILDRYREASGGANISPLTMALNGVIDAAVNGGTEMYTSAFFSPAYLTGNPDAVRSAKELDSELRKQWKTLQEGLDVHEKLVPAELRPLHDKMFRFFGTLRANYEYASRNVTEDPHSAASSSARQGPGTAPSGNVPKSNSVPAPPTAPPVAPAPNVTKSASFGRTAVEAAKRAAPPTPVAVASSDAISGDASTTGGSDGTADMEWDELADAEVSLAKGEPVVHSAKVSSGTSVAEGKVALAGPTAASHAPSPTVGLRRSPQNTYVDVSQASQSSSGRNASLSSTGSPKLGSLPEDDAGPELPRKRSSPVFPSDPRTGRRSPTSFVGDGDVPTDGGVAMRPDPYRQPDPMRSAGRIAVRSTEAPAPDRAVSPVGREALEQAAEPGRIAGFAAANARNSPQEPAAGPVALSATRTSTPQAGPAPPVHRSPPVPATERAPPPPPPRSDSLPQRPAPREASGVPADRLGGKPPPPAPSALPPYRRGGNPPFSSHRYLSLPEQSAAEGKDTAPQLPTTAPPTDALRQSTPPPAVAPKPPAKSRTAYSLQQQHSTP